MEADIQEDSDGRFYRDFYKVVIDDFSFASLLNDISSQQSPSSAASTSSSASIPNASSVSVPSIPYSISSPITSSSASVSISNSTSSSSSSTNQFSNNVSILMKKEFNRFHELVGFEIGNNSTDNSSSTVGVNSTASEGNVLEAINLALSRFESHNIDRDLNRTGQLITVISAGTGYFQITSSKLARITKHRMIEYGIGCDLICISRPPLHIVPLFLFRDKYLASSASTSSVPSSTPSITSTSNKVHSVSTSNLFPSSSHQSPISPEVFNVFAHSHVY